MRKNNDNLKVAIYIPTMNRADFLIRQLEYYARMGCSHPIYIGDSSRSEEKEKIIKTVQRLSNKLTIRLEDHTGLNVVQSIIKLLDLIEEKYTCFIGDDDIQIPSSLDKCARFLEDNPDFSSVSGHAVSVRIKDNKVYGEITRISDYPTGELTMDSASERIVEYLKNYYVIMFYVSKTEQVRKSWESMAGIKDKALAAEIVPLLFTMITGKSKKLDHLAFIRQVHDAHYGLPDTLEWIMGENWRASFLESLDKLSNQLSIKDNISKEKAFTFLKEGFWLYIQKQLTREYYEVFPYRIEKKSPNKAKILKSKLGATAPFARYVYQRWIKPRTTGKRYLHFEVTQPSSKYYEDFKPIKDLLNGQLK